jgi:hypothetical protein
VNLFETEVLPLFEEHREDWLSRARQVAHRLGMRGDEVTIDDVREHIEPPPGKDPRVMGAVFLKSEWESVGYRRSTRKECHNRPIAIFRMKGL